MGTIEQMLAAIDSQDGYGVHVLARGNGVYAVRFASGMYHDAVFSTGATEPVAVGEYTGGE